MRVYKKNTSLKMKSSEKIAIVSDNINYEQLYENVKNYLVFKISVITDLKERLIYLDLKEYMEQIQLEAKKLR